MSFYYFNELMALTSEASHTIYSILDNLDFHYSAPSMDMGSIDLNNVLKSMSTSFNKKGKIR